MTLDKARKGILSHTTSPISTRQTNNDDDNTMNLGKVANWNSGSDIAAIYQNPICPVVTRCCQIRICGRHCVQHRLNWSIAVEVLEGASCLLRRRKKNCCWKLYEWAYIWNWVCQEIHFLTFTRNSSDVSPDIQAHSRTGWLLCPVECTKSRLLLEFIQESHFMTYRKK